MALGLTFELRGRKRRHHSPSKAQNVTAVCGPFERGVRPHAETMEWERET